MKISPTTLFWLCIFVFLIALVPYVRFGEAQGLAFRATTLHWVLVGAMTGSALISAIAFYQSMWRSTVAVKFQGIGAYLFYLLGLIAVVTLISIASAYF